MSGDTYLGRAIPSDFANIYSALDFMISQRLAQISTGTYCKVVRGAYDADGNDIEPGTPGPIGFVDVQPLVNQLDPSDQSTPHGTVYGVSYYRNQTANGAFINDPAVNDIGKLVASDRDLSVVKATGAQGNPGSRRKFAKEDGTFFPCVIAGTPTQWIAFCKNNINIVSSSTLDITTPAGTAAITPNVQTTGNVRVGTGASGTFTAASGQIVTVQDGIIINIF